MPTLGPFARLRLVFIASAPRLRSAAWPRALLALVVSGCFDPTSLDDAGASGDATDETSAEASAASDSHDGPHDDADDEDGDAASDDAEDAASDDASDDAASDDGDDAASDDADDAASDDASDDTTGAASDDATGDASTSASDDAAETTGDASASVSASDDGANDDAAGDDGAGTSGGEPEATALRVFVTSGAFPTNFGGALGADDLCQSVADDADLGGTFRAWVSDSMTSPLVRFQHADEPYALLDGTVLAADWDDLVDGQIGVAIGITESGAQVDPPSTVVATATTEGGTLQPFNGSCADWTTTSNAQSFGVGNEENTFTWSDSGASGCNTLVSLYCFEQ
jgi:hypothetical protein